MSGVCLMAPAFSRAFLTSCLEGGGPPLKGLAPGAILGCPQYKAVGDKALHLFRPAQRYSRPNTVYSVYCLL